MICLRKYQEDMMFERIKLPYGYADLEPHIDRDTIETHYEKHHKTYTDKFNELVAKIPAFEGMSVEEILMSLEKAPADLKNAVKNNGGGYYNHNLYFESMIPGGKKPSGRLLDMINSSYGSVESLLDELHEAATSKLFGSGYAWLVLEQGKLSITISPNQDNPLQHGNSNLLLPVDMWEHAYYLKYKNQKADYVKDFFKVINWERVGDRLNKARQGSYS